jgi:hypothetical protein
MVFARDCDFIERCITCCLHLQPTILLSAGSRPPPSRGFPFNSGSAAHPFADKGVTCSALDLDNERSKMLWYAGRMPGTLAATMVFGAWFL